MSGACGKCRRRLRLHTRRSLAVVATASQTIRLPPWTGGSRQKHSVNRCIDVPWDAATSSERASARTVGQNRFRRAHERALSHQPDVARFGRFSRQPRRRPAALRGHMRSLASTGTIGGRRGVDGVHDLGAVDALQVDRVIPRFVCPSWRWMTISGRPSPTGRRHRGAERQEAGETFMNRCGPRDRGPHEGELLLASPGCPRDSRDQIL
jgi:hypothetical protein